jgi:hypothetical protein
MRAVAYEDVRTVGVLEVPDATVEADTDALVRITSSALNYLEGWPTRAIMCAVHGTTRRTSTSPRTNR